MNLKRRVLIGMVALSALAIVFLPASARQPAQAPSGLAPMEIVAEGLGHVVGIAVDPRQSAYVTDLKAGRIVEVDPDGQAGVFAEHLNRPLGVALDRDGSLNVVEGGTGRILRFEGDGEIGTLASGLTHPRWIAAGPDGRVYVTAKGFHPNGRKGEDGEGKLEVVVSLAPEGSAALFADGFRGLQGLAVEEGALAVVARGRRGERHALGSLYEIPIELDGRGGPVTPLTVNQFAGPAGIAGDRLGVRFVSAQFLAGEPWHRHVILRVARDGTLAIFAEGLADPQGLAFGPDGSLWVADGRAGRVLRFVAPRPPLLEKLPPAVTNRPQVNLRIKSEAGARLTVLGGRVPVTAVADAGGVALVSVRLHPNAENHLAVVATGAGGRGLTGTPLELTVIHDSQPPSIQLLTPGPGALVRGTIAVEALAADPNGVAQVEFRLEKALAGLDAVSPFRVSVDTRAVADGPRTLTVRARDRAGNVARVAAPVLVDNTPPDVRIVAPASGAIEGSHAEIAVEASDATSGVARVEVAVDGVPRFSGESPPYRFLLDLRALGAGLHTLAAAAVDLAGNRGESPPLSITVGGVTVRINEPAEGAAVPSGLLLVRGSVEGGGAEVGVVVQGLPAAVHGNAFAALVPVTPETTSLTALATTASGAAASHTIALTVAPTSDFDVTLQANPASGVAPLSVAFSLLSGSTPDSVELDLEGDGAVDFAGPSLEGHTFVYQQPGLYLPAVTVTDDRGSRITARAVVQVYDGARLDGLLQAKWTTMRDALRRGDVEGALQPIAVDARAEFRADFTALIPFLPTLAAMLEDIRFIAVRGGQTEYELLSVEDGATFSYYVEFIRDADGIWRIAFF